MDCTSWIDSPVAVLVIGWVIVSFISRVMQQRAKQRATEAQRQAGSVAPQSGSGTGTGASEQGGEQRPAAADRSGSSQPELPEAARLFLEALGMELPETTRQAEPSNDDRQNRRRGGEARPGGRSDDSSEHEPEIGEQAVSDTGFDDEAEYQTGDVRPVRPAHDELLRGDTAAAEGAAPGEPGSRPWDTTGGRSGYDRESMHPRPPPLSGATPRQVAARYEGSGAPLPPSASQPPGMGPQVPSMAQAAAAELTDMLAASWDSEDIDERDREHVRRWRPHHLSQGAGERSAPSESIPLVVRDALVMQSIFEPKRFPSGRRPVGRRRR